MPICDEILSANSSVVDTSSCIKLLESESPVFAAITLTSAPISNAAFAKAKPCLPDE